MDEFKYDIGDKVIVDYPDDAVSGLVCTILARHHIAPLPSNYYELKEVRGIYVERVLLPYLQAESLVPNADLKTLFSGGKEHG